jgi:two-component system LytT family sensor kinase
MQPAKKRIWVEISLHLIFWAGVLYVLTSLNSSHIHIWIREPHITSDQERETTISPYVYIILAYLAALFYGNVFLVFPKVIRYKSGILRVAICAGWLALVFAANYLVVGPLFDQANPVPKPSPEFAPFRQDTIFRRDTILNLGNLKSDDRQNAFFRPPSEAVTFVISDWRQIQPVILLAFLVIEGIAMAYFFLKEWAKSELIQTQLQANQLSTEIKFLKSQINPHFLFNTLNNLFSMAQNEGNDELADGISKLSGMMRYMLYDSNEESAPLTREITYLEECITLNKLRYADEEVIITFDHTGQTADIRIAPMLFIPFVENAFKHGVAIGQTAAIQIALVVSGQNLIFTCVNTDFSKIRKMEMEISGIGLENIKRRLELVYPRKHRLTINKEDGKFMVNLEIDLS